MQAESYTQFKIYCTVLFIAMVANFLTAFISMSIGLYFQYAVATAAARAIAIAMYALASVIFVGGELIYFARLSDVMKMKKQYK